MYTITDGYGDTYTGSKLSDAILKFARAKGHLTGHCEPLTITKETDDLIADEVGVEGHLIDIHGFHRHYVNALENLDMVAKYHDELHKAMWLPHAHNIVTEVL